MTKRITALLLLLAVMLFAVSCMRVSAAELSAGYEKKDAGVAGAHDELFYGGFALSLLRGAIKEKGKNALVSPYSAAAALALLANGAGGESLAQIERAFGITLEDLNSETVYLLGSLKTSDKCRISRANSLWVNESWSSGVKSSYLQKNADLFGAQIYSAPFDGTTVSDINNWCGKNTGGMIRNIIGELPSETVLMGINALYFDAEWNTKYEKDDIRKRVFNNYDGTKTEKDFLCSNEYVLYGDGYVGFYKEYEGGNYCFSAIMPDEGDIYDFLSSLDRDKLISVWKDRTAESASVKLPEFKFDGEADLKEIFEENGITDIFDPNRADLSAMGDTGLYVTAFEQKTRIELDRNGTKAAAITFFGGAGSAAPPPTEIIFDRPFIFTITDTSNGMPLFFGLVSDLS